MNYANTENILCNRGLIWHSSDNALNHCVGSSNTSTRMQRIFAKLATVCSDWDFQHNVVALEILDCVHWELQ